ncbi:HicB family toxin-antitoxin system [Rhodococcus antarcticus]|jgi:hypothetical protein|uniref:HicB family toxin-antitoxin system n=1 Tax=Rhodococcus antarcticus TaxID=2987751 RepID=A0ABY6NZD4_9NOCA|nr:HicB family toxin-antitoxin system [Rhodococcus antarcticus]UZJ24764.1 HicB family toxin-antitoxin system [Rhodococcus antarcticus]
MNTTYQVEVTREGKWWMVAVPALDVITQARRYADIGTTARELVAVVTDEPLSHVTVHIHLRDVDGIPNLDDTVTELTTRAAAAEQERKDLQARKAALAQSLVKANVPVRDVGSLLGVSYQRAQQLATPA